MIPSDHEFDPAVHLTRSDIAIDNKVNPRVMQVFLKQSKTELFRQGIMLYLGKAGTEICMVTTVLAYVVVGSRQEGLLFRYQDGRYLTRQRLVTEFRCVLERAGPNQTKYCGHSFRIGLPPWQQKEA